jgi:hypothetical protein
MGVNRRLAGPIVVWTLLYVVVAAVYILSGVKQPWDSLWTLQKSYSIWTSGNTDLNEWADVIPEDDYGVRRSNGRLHSYFPDGTALLVSPVVGIRAWIDGGGDDLPPLTSWSISDTQEALASLIVALAVVFTGLAGAELGLNRNRAVLLAAILAFGTQAWSSASRGLWSHGPTMLALSMAVYLLLRSRRPGARVGWWGIGAGLALGFSYVCRPTAAIPALVLAVLALRWGRRLGMSVIAGGEVVAVLFVLHNEHNYGVPLPAYYLPGRLAGSGKLWVALAGHAVRSRRQPESWIIHLLPSEYRGPVGAVALAWPRSRPRGGHTHHLRAPLDHDCEVPALVGRALLRSEAVQ